MADDPVVAERGVLSAHAEAWSLAVRRAEVIRDLAAQRVVSLEAADAAAGYAKEFFAVEHCRGARKRGDRFRSRCSPQAA